MTNFIQNLVAQFDKEIASPFGSLGHHTAYQRDGQWHISYVEAEGTSQEDRYDVATVTMDGQVTRLA